jgi:hypothetical protein
MRGNRGLHYLRTNFDYLTITTALAAIALTPDPTALTDTDYAMLAALRRSSNALEDAPLAEIQDYLGRLSESQLPGLVSNVKGILHEMQFVRLENEDGDNTYASYFDATNHPGTDVQLMDASTGESWEAQLKATDSATYVTDWIDEHPGVDILVTEEIAQRMQLPTSGLSNQELTTDVESFVDRMISSDGADGFWDYFPVLSAASAGLVVWSLWQRQQRGEINRATFTRLAAMATGLKLAKVASIGLLLSIPVVGQATGAVLVAKLLLSAKATWFDNSRRVQSSFQPTPPKALPAS